MPELRPTGHVGLAWLAVCLVLRDAAPAVHPHQQQCRSGRICDDGSSTRIPFSRDLQA